MSYECILKCVPFYIIYALKFVLPSPPSPAVGNNLVVHSFPSSESVPCLPRTSVTDQPVADPARRELCQLFEVFRWRESFQYRVTGLLGTFWNSHSCSLLFLTAEVLDFIRAFHGRAAGPSTHCPCWPRFRLFPRHQPGAWAPGDGVGSGRVGPRKGPKARGRRMPSSPMALKLHVFMQWSPWAPF